MDVDELHNRFAYHRPASPILVEEVFPRLRTDAENLALLIDRFVPDGREKALAVTKIEEAVMWAIAGIARNQPTPTDE